MMKESTSVGIEVPCVDAELSAYPVESQVSKILIPPGLSPGDTFIYTPENGRAITVVVPEGSSPGTYINIVSPDEVVVAADSKKQPAGATGRPVRSVSSRNKDGVGISTDSQNINIGKATAGAALIGGVLGAVVLGPIGALVLAGGAAYATTRKKGNVGKSARKVGTAAFEGVEKGVDWITKNT
jgi:hypothetical protein